MPKMFRALEDGFDGYVLRKQGAEFQAHDGFKAPWAKPLDAELLRSKVKVFLRR